MRKFLKNFIAGVQKLPAFAARTFGRELPPLRIMGRTGDARYVPQTAVFTPKKNGTRVQQANRLDDVDWIDYDRARFYPVIRDGIRSIVAPASRANVHFVCSRKEVAELIQQEFGPLLADMIKQFIRGGLEFGYHAAEIRWTAKFDVFTTSGLQDGGEEGSGRYYPFIWTVSRFAHFHPMDTRILIDSANGDFAGIRQYQVVRKGDADVPARKCLLYVNDREFDRHYGVPISKPAIPFIDVALSLWDNVANYGQLFAVPGMIGRYPMGRTSFADGSIMENADIMQRLVEAIGSGHKMSLPSNLYDAGGLKWDVTYFQPVSTQQPYTELIGLINDQIRLAIGVNEMASSETTDTGGLGDQGAEDKIGLFLANIEGILDEFKSQIVKVANDYRIYNFGQDCPPVAVYIEPVDMNVTKALLAAVVQILSSGQPIQDAEGNLIYPDWGKILQDKGIPVVSVSGKRLAQQLLDAAQKQIGQRTNPEGGEGGPAGEQLVKGLAPEAPKPPTIEAREEAMNVLKLAIGAIETAPAIRAKLLTLAEQLEAEACPHCGAIMEKGDDGLCNSCRKPWNGKNLSESGVRWERVEMAPQDLAVHPDMQYKDGAGGEHNVRPEGVSDTYDAAKAGVYLGWEAADGTRYVVNGHHRRASAIAAKEPSVPVDLCYEADGVTFEQARNLGIAQNAAHRTLSE